MPIFDKKGPMVEEAQWQKKPNNIKKIKKKNCKKKTIMLERQE